MIPRLAKHITTLIDHIKIKLSLFNQNLIDTTRKKFNFLPKSNVCKEIFLRSVKSYNQKSYNQEK